MDLLKKGMSMVSNTPEIENKVREATSNKNWGPSGSQMQELARATNNYEEFPIVMSTIWRRMNDPGKYWRHVYKSLLLLDYLIKNGSEQVVREAKHHRVEIQTLSQFQCIEEDKDVGVSVRERAKAIVDLLQDDDRIRSEREKAQKNAGKYGGFGSEGGVQPRAFGSESYGGGGGSSYGGGGGGYGGSSTTGYGGHGSSGGFGGSSSSYGGGGGGGGGYGGSSGNGSSNNNNHNHNNNNNNYGGNNSDSDDDFNVRPAAPVRQAAQPVATQPSFNAFAPVQQQQQQQPQYTQPPAQPQYSQSAAQPQQANRARAPSGDNAAFFGQPAQPAHAQPAQQQGSFFGAPMQPAQPVASSPFGGTPFPQQQQQQQQAPFGGTQFPAQQHQQQSPFGGTPFPAQQQQQSPFGGTPFPAQQQQQQQSPFGSQPAQTAQPARPFDPFAPLTPQTNAVDFGGFETASSAPPASATAAPAAPVNADPWAAQGNLFNLDSLGSGKSSTQSIGGAHAMGAPTGSGLQPARPAVAPVYGTPVVMMPMGQPVMYAQPQYGQPPAQPRW